MSTSQAIFHQKLLEKYQVVLRPGTHVVSVASSVTDKNFIDDEYPRYLVSLRVIPGDKLDELLSIVPNEVVKVPFDKVRQCFLTGVLWEADVDPESLPIKGEKILATFEEKDDTIICSHLEVLPREELEYLNLNDIDYLRQKLADLIQY